jgi:UDP-N-acetylmuramate dehydrogenase
MVKQVPLAPRTTMGCGGPARLFASIADADGARDAVAWANQSGTRWWLLGGGSNVLVADEGLDGLVLQPTDGSRHAGQERDGEVEVQVGAGHDWDELVAWSVAQGLAGIECLSGIPGLAGAAPIQNIGAYGQSIADCLVAVQALDCAAEELREWTAEECGFSYRDSVFKRAGRGRFLVTSLRLRLRAAGRATLAYAELRRRLGVTEASAGNGGAPTLRQVREAVLALRRGKGMVIDPADPDSRSAGSFFLNPIVDQATALQVKERMAARASMPSWRMDPRDGRAQVKLSAAWLIEQSGMKRGFGDGPVGLSSKHTLAVVNRGGASTLQVLNFAAEVRQRVLDRCGVRLEREPVVLGPHGDGPLD